ncbi:MAG: squalene/phytoene synthase family protein [Magnetospirillum sp.]|nr:squalene/phytoene synthase family protein [Magnetospirillum sp.]
MTVPRQGASPPPAHGLSHAAERVRRFDRERFATALFAPPERREALMVLYAFNVAVASVRERVREPLAGALRLQWWRDVLAAERPEEEVSAHPVAGPLAALVRSGAVPAHPLLRLLDGRERDLSGETFADLDDLEAYAEATAATLTEAALAALGATDESSLEAGRRVGIACALVGLARALPHHLSIGRLAVPPPALSGTGQVRIAADRARRLLDEAGRRPVARNAVPALLPATYAAAHLRRLERAGWDVSAPHLGRYRPMPLRLAVNALLGRFA